MLTCMRTAMLNHQHLLCSLSTAVAHSEASQPLLGSILASSYARQVTGKGRMRHGTEGWRCLETSFKAGCLPCCTFQLRQYTFQCTPPVSMAALVQQQEQQQQQATVLRAQS